MNLSTEQFSALAAHNGAALISAYMPTHRGGAETRQDRIRLRNALSEIERRLDEQSIPRRDVAPAIESIEALDADAEFWRHQADGLAIFASNEALRTHRLGIRVREHALVADRFCLRPLVLSVSDGRFHVLAVSQGSVRLIECGPSGARELDAHDVPDRLADVLGYDWEQKSLQFHTGARLTGAVGSSRAAVFHGHGRGHDEEKRETSQFLRRVSEAVTALLRDEGTPLVIAAVDYEVAMYREHSEYPNLVDRALEGNPEHLSAEDLRERALECVRPALDAEAREHRDRLAALAHSQAVVSGVPRVLAACADGRVGSLFVHADEPVWGAWNERARRADIHEERQPGDDDLLDLAVSKAAATGAQVYSATRADLPNQEPVAAITRY